VHLPGQAQLQDPLEPSPHGGVTGAEDRWVTMRRHNQLFSSVGRASDCKALCFCVLPNLFRDNAGETCVMFQFVPSAVFLYFHSMWFTHFCPSSLHGRHVTHTQSSHFLSMQLFGHFMLEALSVGYFIELSAAIWPLDPPSTHLTTIHFAH
jgi:hypothetical protein